MQAVPALRKLLLVKPNCHGSADINVNVNGHSYCTNYDLELRDPTVNIMHVIRQIADDTTELTSVERPDGNLLIKENGRLIQVGTFTGQTFHANLPDVTFNIELAPPNWRDNVQNIDITADDLDSLEINVAEYDDDGKLAVAK
jgi:hypothetical protein